MFVFRSVQIGRRKQQLIRDDLKEMLLFGIDQSVPEQQQSEPLLSDAYTRISQEKTSALKENGTLQTQLLGIAQQKISSYLCIIAKENRL